MHADEKASAGVAYSAGKRSLAGCYMELHAVTKTNATPGVFRR